MENGSSEFHTDDGHFTPKEIKRRNFRDMTNNKSTSGGVATSAGLPSYTRLATVKITRAMTQ